MKFMLICVVFGTLLYDVKCTNNTEFLNHMSKIQTIITNMVKEQCYQDSEKNLQKFKALLDNSTMCLIITSQQAPVFVTPINTFKHNIQNCFNEVMEELENCLPKEYKDLPQLDLDISFAMVDFVYENKDDLFSSQLSSYVQNCVKTIREEKTEEEILNCFDYNTTQFGIKASCNQLEKWGKCFSVEINKRCPPDELFEKLRKLFVEAIKEPCDEYLSSATENSLDLLTLLAPYAPMNINPDLM